MTSVVTSAFATATETADAIQAKKISALEVVRQTFERIDRHNPVLNAIVWEDRERALARARQAGRGVGATTHCPRLLSFAKLLANLVGGFSPPPQFAD